MSEKRRQIKTGVREGWRGASVCVVVVSCSSWRSDQSTAMNDIPSKLAYCDTSPRSSLDISVPREHEHDPVGCGRDDWKDARRRGGGHVFCRQLKDGRIQLCPF